MSHFRVPYIAGAGFHRDHVYPALGTPAQVNSVTGLVDPIFIADQTPYFTLDQTMAVLWRICGWRFVSSFSVALIVEGTTPNPGTEEEAHAGSASIDMSAPDPTNAPLNDFFPYTDGNGNPETDFDKRVIADGRKWAVFGNDPNPNFHFIPSGLQPPGGNPLDANTGQSGVTTFTVAGDHNGTPYVSTPTAMASGTSLSFLTGAGTSNAIGNSTASLAIFDPLAAGVEKFYPFPSFTSAVTWNMLIFGLSRQASAFISGPVKTPETSEGNVIGHEGFNVWQVRFPVEVILDPVIAPTITFKAQGQVQFPPFSFIGPPPDPTLLVASGAGSLAITANKFVPFLNSQGLPIYDENSGGQLRDPLS